MIVLLLITRYSFVLFCFKALVIKVTEHSSDRKQDEGSSTSNASSNVSSIPTTANNSQVKVSVLFLMYISFHFIIFVR